MIDKEIQELAKKVTPTGDPLRGRNPFPYRWQKAMRLWNGSHAPVQMTLEAIESAFKKKWPCSISKYSANGKMIMMSIPLCEFSFTVSSKGIAHGFVHIADGKRFGSDIFMSPSQLTDLSASIMEIIYPRSVTEEIESRLSTLQSEIDVAIYEENKIRQDETQSTDRLIKIFELYYEQFEWLNRINRHEDALEAIKNAFFYHNLIAQFEDRNNNIIYNKCIIGGGTCRLEYETIEYNLYAGLANTLLRLGRLNEAIMSYRSLYNRKLKYVEQGDIWHGTDTTELEDKTECYSKTFVTIDEYCKWVDNYCSLLFIARQDDKAREQLSRSISIVKSLVVLKEDDMNFELGRLISRLKTY